MYHVRGLAASDLKRFTASKSRGLSSISVELYCPIEASGSIIHRPTINGAGKIGNGPYTNR